MSCVFQNIDPPPPSPPGLCCGGRTHSPDGEGGGGSIFWKTQDTALYSTYIEYTLCILFKIFVKIQNKAKKLDENPKIR
jgi:hypothetical protein